MTKRIVVVIDMDDRNLKGEPLIDCDPKTITHGSDEPLEFCIAVHENGQLLLCSHKLTISPSAHKRRESKEERLYKKVVRRR